MFGWFESRNKSKSEERQQNKERPVPPFDFERYRFWRRPGPTEPVPTLKEAIEAGDANMVARALGFDPASEEFHQSYEVKCSLPGQDPYFLNGTL